MVRSNAKRRNYKARNRRIQEDVKLARFENDLEDMRPDSEGRKHKFSVGRTTNFSKKKNQKPPPNPQRKANAIAANRRIANKMTKGFHNPDKTKEDRLKNREAHGYVKPKQWLKELKLMDYYFMYKQNHKQEGFNKWKKATIDKAIEICLALEESWGDSLTDKEINLIDHQLNVFFASEKRKHNKNKVHPSPLPKQKRANAKKRLRQNQDTRAWENLKGNATKGVHLTTTGKKYTSFKQLPKNFQTQARKQVVKPRMSKLTKATIKPQGFIDGAAEAVTKTVSELAEYVDKEIEKGIDKIAKPLSKDEEVVTDLLKGDVRMSKIADAVVESTGLASDVGLPIPDLRDLDLPELFDLFEQGKLDISGLGNFANRLDSLEKVLKEDMGEVLKTTVADAVKLSKDAAEDVLKQVKDAGHAALKNIKIIGGIIVAALGLTSAIVFLTKKDHREVSIPILKMAGVDADKMVAYICAVENRAECEELEPQGSDDIDANVSEGFTQSITDMYKLLFKDIDKKTWKDNEWKIKRFHDKQRMIKDLKGFVDLLKDWAIFFAQMIFQHFTTLPWLTTPQNVVLRRQHSLVDEAVAMHADFRFKNTYTQTEKLHIHDVYTRMLQCSVDSDKLNLPNYYSSRFRDALTLVKQLDESTVYATPPRDSRPQPVAICFSGPAGYGKTEAINALKSNLLDVLLGPDRREGDGVFLWPTGEHWDGLDSTKLIIQLEEFLQSPNTQTRNQEATNVIKLLSTGPTVVPIADLAGKNKAHMDCKFFLTNTNFETWNHAALMPIVSSPDGLVRRMDIFVRAGLKDGKQIPPLTGEFDPEMTFDVIYKPRIIGGKLCYLDDSDGFHKDMTLRDIFLLALNLSAERAKDHEDKRVGNTGYGKFDLPEEMKQEFRDRIMLEPQGKNMKIRDFTWEPPEELESSEDEFLDVFEQLNEEDYKNIEENSDDVEFMATEEINEETQEVFEKEKVDPMVYKVRKWFSRFMPWHFSYTFDDDATRLLSRVSGQDIYSADESPKSTVDRVENRRKHEAKKRLRKLRYLLARGTVAMFPREMHELCIKTDHIFAALGDTPNIAWLRVVSCMIDRGQFEGNQSETLYKLAYVYRNTRIIPNGPVQDQFPYFVSNIMEYCLTTTAHIPISEDFQKACDKSGERILNDAGYTLLKLFPKMASHDEEEFYDAAGLLYISPILRAQLWNKNVIMRRTKYAIMGSAGILTVTFLGWWFLRNVHPVVDQGYGGGAKKPKNKRHHSGKKNLKNLQAFHGETYNIGNFIAQGSNDLIRIYQKHVLTIQDVHGVGSDIFALSENKLLVPGHTISRLKDTFFIWKVIDADKTINIKFDSSDIHVLRFSKIDQALITITKKEKYLPFITTLSANYFCPISMQENMTQGPMMRVEKDKMVAIPHGVNMRYSRVEYGKDWEYGSDVSFEAFVAGATAICGSVYCSAVDRYNFMILGTHTHGNLSSRSGGVPLSREFITSCLAFDHNLIEEQGYISTEFMEHTGREWVRKAKNSFANTNTNIVPTFFQAKPRVPIDSAPALMDDTDDLHVIENSLGKKIDFTPYEGEAPQSMKTAAKIFAHELKPYFQPRVVDLDEALNGNYWVKPIVLKTSAGYGFSGPGKRSYLEVNEDGVIDFVDDEIREKFIRTLRLARSGIEDPNYPCVVSDVIKDETLPTAKITAGMSRIMGPLPLFWLIIERMIFIPIIMAILKWRNFGGPIDVGIDYAADWIILIKNKLNDLQPTQGAVAGDLKTCDARTPRCIFDLLDEVVCELYGDTYPKEFIKFLGDLLGRKVKHDILNVQYTTCGNPSGRAMTTMVNSFTVFLISVSAYLEENDFGREYDEELQPTSLKDFIKSLCIYGDDHVIPVNKENPCVTMHSLARVCESVGMTYTNIYKDKPLVDYLDWKEVVYLKRRLTHDKNGLPCAPLQKEVIEQMLFWTQKTLQSPYRELELYKSCLYECVQWDEDYFNDMKKYLDDMFNEYAPWLPKPFIDYKSIKANLIGYSFGQRFRVD